MVAIKDFGMPSCCYECDLHNYHNCDLTNDDIEKHLDDGKHPNCPLVEIEERKVGKWIDDCGFIDKSYRKYECFNCGESVYEKPYQIKYHKYCLHCGAEMRGVRE